MVVTSSLAVKYIQWTDKVPSKKGTFPHFWTQFLIKETEVSKLGKSSIVYIAKPQCIDSKPLCIDSIDSRTEFNQSELVGPGIQSTISSNQEFTTSGQPLNRG